MHAEDPAHRLTDTNGVVKWFDPRKGFGFIVGPEGQDIFVHYSQIHGDGYRILNDGDRVVYSAEFGDRGWHATRVAKQAASRPAPDVRVRAVAPAPKPAADVQAKHPAPAPATDAAARGDDT